MLRVIIPDSHGAFADSGAMAAFTSDLAFLKPQEIVMLGDHVDVSGTFSGHPKTYVEEMRYSYEDDIAHTNRHLDVIQKAAPGAVIHYIEGNHEQHVERWIARNFQHVDDAENTRCLLAPEYKLNLKKRGIKFYRRSQKYMGISVPGTIKLGKCLFTHGSHAGVHATAQHLSSFGTNVVHGHTHRAQSCVRRTAVSNEIGAWCFGTLATLQPLYLHTGVSSWSHGYGLQLVEKTGRFLTISVPIVNGRSMLQPLLAVIGKPTNKRAA